MATAASKLRSADPIRVTGQASYAGHLQLTEILGEDLLVRSGVVLAGAPPTGPDAGPGLRIALSGTLEVEAGAGEGVTHGAIGRALPYQEREEGEEGSCGACAGLWNLPNASALVSVREQGHHEAELRQCLLRASGRRQGRQGRCLQGSESCEEGRRQEEDGEGHGLQEKEDVIFARTDAKANGPHIVRPVRLSPGTVSFIFSAEESG